MNLLPADSISHQVYFIGDQSAWDTNTARDSFPLERVRQVLEERSRANGRFYTSPHMVSAMRELFSDVQEKVLYALNLPSPDALSIYRISDAGTNIPPYQARAIAALISSADTPFVISADGRRIDGLNSLYTGSSRRTALFEINVPPGREWTTPVEIVGWVITSPARAAWYLSDNERTYYQYDSASFFYQLIDRQGDSLLPDSRYQLGFDVSISTQDSSFPLQMQPGTFSTVPFVALQSGIYRLRARVQPEWETGENWQPFVTAPGLPEVNVLPLRSHVMFGQAGQQGDARANRIVRIFPEDTLTVSISWSGEGRGPYVPVGISAELAFSGMGCPEEAILSLIPDDTATALVADEILFTEIVAGAPDAACTVEMVVNYNSTAPPVNNVSQIVERRTLGRVRATNENTVTVSVVSSDVDAQGVPIFGAPESVTTLFTAQGVSVTEPMTLTIPLEVRRNSVMESLFSAQSLPTVRIFNMQGEIASLSPESRVRVIQGSVNGAYDIVVSNFQASKYRFEITFPSLSVPHRYALNLMSSDTAGQEPFRLYAMLEVTQDWTLFWWRIAVTVIVSLVIAIIFVLFIRHLLSIMEPLRSGLGIFVRTNRGKAVSYTHLTLPTKA
jgi:hypothetical protein